MKSSCPGPVAAARDRVQNPRELSDRVAMGRALWRELVIGFAAQLGELRLGFTQLAALYVLADAGTTTIADLADALGRSPVGDQPARGRPREARASRSGAPRPTIVASGPSG